MEKGDFPYNHEERVSPSEAKKRDGELTLPVAFRFIHSSILMSDSYKSHDSLSRIESSEGKELLTHTDKVALAMNYTAWVLVSRAREAFQFIRDPESRKRALTALVCYEKENGSIQNIEDIVERSDDSIFEYGLVQAALHAKDTPMADWHASHTPDLDVQSECYAAICEKLFVRAAFGTFKPHELNSEDQKLSFALAKDLISFLQSCKLQAQALQKGLDTCRWLKADTIELKRHFIEELVPLIHALSEEPIRNKMIRSIGEAMLEFESAENVQVYINREIPSLKERELFAVNRVRFYTQKDEWILAQRSASDVRDPLIRVYAYCEFLKYNRAPDDIYDESIEKISHSLQEVQRLNIHTDEEQDEALAVVIGTRGWRGVQELERELSGIETSLVRDTVRERFVSLALHGYEDSVGAYQIVRFIADPCLQTRALEEIMDHYIENGAYDSAQQVIEDITIPHVRIRLLLKFAENNMSRARNSTALYELVEREIANIPLEEDRHKLMADYIESVVMTASLSHEITEGVLEGIDKECLMKVILEEDASEDMFPAMAYLYLNAKERSELLQRVRGLPRQRKAIVSERIVLLYEMFARD